MGFGLVALTIAALVLGLVGCSAAQARGVAATTPVYIHMNGANHFLEPLVAVAPGQPVVFVNQDTGGAHTIVGYDPLTGAKNPAINGLVQRSKGAGQPASTYTVRFAKAGFYSYYCSVHARLAKTFGGAVQPAYRNGVGGFKGAMAGTIVVTSDPALLAADPPSTKLEELPGFFGG